MPLADHEVRDPRVKRTRRLLQDALRVLLESKPLDDILVQDIADAATINRATFYDHYSDKFQLFNALIASDFQTLVEQRNISFGQGCPSGLAAIVLAVGDFLQQVHRDQTACALQTSGPLMDSAITLAIRAIVLEGIPKQPRGAPASREVVASLLSGAIYGAIKESLAKSKWRANERVLLALVPLFLPLLEPPH